MGMKVESEVEAGGGDINNEGDKAEENN